jgi:hypothetical protein
MISHRARRFLIACLAALHAGLSLCGPGHHEPARADAHGGEAITSSLVAAGDPSATCRTDGHCLVCDYLTLAALPVGLEAPSPTRERVGPPVPALPPSHRPALVHTPSSPRAPPLVDVV